MEKKLKKTVKKEKKINICSKSIVLTKDLLSCQFFVYEYE